MNTLNNILNIEIEAILWLPVEAVEVDDLCLGSSG